MGSLLESGTRHENPCERNVARQGIEARSAEPFVMAPLIHGMLERLTGGILAHGTTPVYSAMQ
jgi:hypothetical protein